MMICIYDVLRLNSLHTCLLVCREADYTLGIFQSIGFKEFHEFLLLPPGESETATGRALQQEGQVTSGRSSKLISHSRTNVTTFT